MKKKIYILVLFSMFTFKSFSQTYQALQIGDKVPDITLKGFFDDDKKSVKISELYKGKLLILDFWGTWCTACLNEMQTFPRLKAKFGDKLNIVAVGYEEKKAIEALFKRSPQYHSKQWITLYKDSILTRTLFPHKSIPHLAWIDATGKVIAITDGEYLNPVNIENAISGKNLDVRLKQDLLGPDDIDRPFNLMDTNFVARTIVTRRVPGISFDSKQPYTLTKPYKYNRIFMGNETIQNMYWFGIADGTVAFGNNSRLKFEIKDSLKFIHPKYAPKSFKLSNYKNYDNWADSNLYCYDLVLPKLVPDSLIRQYFLADLNRYFNLNGRWDYRMTDCYVIQDQAKIGKEQSVVSTQQDQSDPSLRKMGDFSRSQLTDYFNRRLQFGYILDESKLPPDNKIKLDTRYKSLNAHQIAGILKELGFVLIETKRKILIYVISEN